MDCSGEEQNTNPAAAPGEPPAAEAWQESHQGSSPAFQSLAPAQIHSRTIEIIVLVLVRRSKSSPNCWISLGDQKT